MPDGRQVRATHVREDEEWPTRFLKSPRPNHLGAAINFNADGDLLFMERPLQIVWFQLGEPGVLVSSILHAGPVGEVDG